MARSYILSTRKLGKRAPRLDPRNLKLARYLKPTLPAAPPAAGYIAKVKSWPMMLNDTLGDCVIAAAAHCIEQWTTYAKTPVVLTDDQVLQGYEAVGGYIPGDPSTDNGCDMLTACKYWQTTGFGRHKIAAYVQVDPLNLTEIKQAIYLFGNVYAGWQLPLSVQSSNIWSVPSTGANGDASPGTWGGHCLVPQTRVLTDDLRWVDIGSVKTGDRLMGFDEYPVGHPKRAFRTAIVTSVEMLKLPRWYNKPAERLAVQAVKYQQRDGWSHGDLLRLALLRSKAVRRHRLLRQVRVAAPGPRASLEPRQAGPVGAGAPL